MTPVTQPAAPPPIIPPCAPVSAVGNGWDDDDDDLLADWARERVLSHLGPGAGCTPEQRAAYNRALVAYGFQDWSPYNPPLPARPPELLEQPGEGAAAVHPSILEREEASR